MSDWQSGFCHSLDVCVSEGWDSCLSGNLHGSGEPVPSVWSLGGSRALGEAWSLSSIPWRAGTAACSWLPELFSVSMLRATPEGRGKGFFSVAEPLHSRLRDPE